MVHHGSSTLCSVGGYASTWGSEGLHAMTTLHQTALGKETCLRGNTPCGKDGDPGLMLFQAREQIMSSQSSALPN